MSPSELIKAARRGDVTPPRRGQRTWREKLTDRGQADYIPAIEELIAGYVSGTLAIGISRMRFSRWVVEQIPQRPLSLHPIKEEIDRAYEAKKEAQAATTRKPRRVARVG